MSGFNRLSLLLFLSIFVLTGCSGSDVTDSSNNSRSAEHPSEDWSPGFPEDGTPPPEDGTPPPEDGTPPPEDGTPPPEDGTPPPVSKSGSGLFYTAEELDIWNNRRLSGQYKANWDNRIMRDAQLFMSNKKDRSPWSGRVKAGCHPGRSALGGEFPGDSGRSKEAGMKAHSAAFVYRVLKHAGEDAKAKPYFDKVKSYLLKHTVTSGINFRDSEKWCYKTMSTEGVHQFIAGWARRIAIVYSWLREDMSEADRQKMDHWIKGVALLYIRHSEWHLSYYLTGRYENDYKYVKNPPTGNRDGVLYDGGPDRYQINDAYNNRGAVTASLATIVGVLIGDNTLRDKGARYFRDALIWSIWPDGAYVDIARQSPTPVNGFSYPGVFIGTMGQAADVLARAGDSQLYDLSTRKGLAGTESKSGQPAKSFFGVLNHFAGQVDGKVKKYVTGSPHTDGNIINPYNSRKAGKSSWADLYMIQSNLYYKSSYIRSIYERTAPGTRPRTAQSLAGYDEYTGDWSTFPDVEFMWGALEGKVWPYGNARSRKSVQYMSPICDSGQRNCSADVGIR